jgi:hypothetical protein
MPRWYCKDCGHVQPSNPGTCDSCGHPILEPVSVRETDPQRPQGGVFWAKVALGLALLLGFAVGFVMYLSAV